MGHGGTGAGASWLAEIDIGACGFKIGVGETCRSSGLTRVLGGRCGIDAEVNGAGLSVEGRVVQDGTGAGSPWFSEIEVTVCETNGKAGGDGAFEKKAEECNETGTTSLSRSSRGAVEVRWRSSLIEDTEGGAP